MTWELEEIVMNDRGALDRITFAIVVVILALFFFAFSCPGCIGTFQTVKYQDQGWNYFVGHLAEHLGLCVLQTHQCTHADDAELTIVNSGKIINL